MIFSCNNTSGSFQDIRFTEDARREYCRFGCYQMMLTLASANAKIMVPASVWFLMRVSALKRFIRPRGGLLQVSLNRTYGSAYCTQLNETPIKNLELYFQGRIRQSRHPASVVIFN